MAPVYGAFFHEGDTMFPFLAVIGLHTAAMGVVMSDLASKAAGPTLYPIRLLVLVHIVGGFLLASVSAVLWAVSWML